MAQTRKNVIVLGAGLTGLSAAQACSKAGHMVQVVEARNRVGGRIWTSREWPDLPTDMGASWIHGVSGNPLTNIADKANIKRVGTSYTSATAYGPGDDIDDALHTMSDTLDRIRESGDPSDHDSLADIITRSHAWRDMSKAEKRLMLHVVNGNYEQEYGADWSESSANYIDASKEFGGGDVLFPGGFDQITAVLARGLDIRLNTEVLSVTPMISGGVVVRTAGGDLQADCAIVTFPLGVLQARTDLFSEALDSGRQRAISQLGMGLLNKCWLRFDKIAWDNDVDWIESVGSQPGKWSQWVSLARRLRAPVLLAFHAGRIGRELEDLPLEAIMGEAHVALKSIYGSSFPAPKAAQVSRWSKDSFALGAYSFNKAGMERNARKALAGPDWDGRLVFAGEACSHHYHGTAHGAYLSGVDAAKLV